MSFKGLLNRKVTINGSAESKSITGEVTDSWSEKAANVPCAITSRSANSRLEDYGVSVEFDNILYFDHDVDIEPAGEEGPRDQVVDEDGNTYAVVFVRDITGRGLYKEVLVRRIA